MLLDDLAGEPHVCTLTARFCCRRLTAAPRRAGRQQKPLALGVTRQMAVGLQLPPRVAPSGAAHPSRRPTGLRTGHPPPLRGGPCIRATFGPRRSASPSPQSRAVATSRPAPVSRAVVADLPRSVLPHLDPSRPRRVATRDRQFQDTVLQVRIDLRCVEVGAQGERAREMRSTDLGVLQPQTCGSWHHRFGLDIEISVVHLHVEFALRYTRQVRPQRDAWLSSNTSTAGVSVIRRAGCSPSRRATACWSRSATWVLSWFAP